MSEISKMPFNDDSEPNKLKAHLFWSVIAILFFGIWIALIPFIVFHKNMYDTPSSSKNPGNPNKCPPKIPYLYYMDYHICSSLAQIARVECPSHHVCLDHCPAITYTPDFNDKVQIEMDTMYWNDIRDVVICIMHHWDILISEPPKYYKGFVTGVAKGLCAKNVFRSKSIFNKVCMPVELDLPQLEHLRDHPVQDVSEEERASMSIMQMKRRSYEMFYIWVCIASIMAVFFICLYLILLLYCIRFTIYCSLSIFLLLLIAGLCYSAAMILFAALRESNAEVIDPDWTLGLSWMYWSVICAIILIFFYLFCDFIRKCYFSIPHAIQFLIYVNRGLGGVRSAVAFLVLVILLQLAMVTIFILLVIEIYNSADHMRRISDLSRDCLCINGYTNGSDCTVTSYEDWCRDRVSGGPCIQGSCDLYDVKLDSYQLFILVTLVITTYYLMWFVKGFVDMILGTTFVHWYMRSFTSTIPFKLFLKKTGYCLKYQSGTLAFGSLVMFFIGVFHICFQFIENLVLFSVEMKRIKRKKILIVMLEKLSKMTSPHIYIEAGVHNSSYWGAIKRVDLTMASKIKNIRLINKLVDMVLFICALLIVVLVSIGLLVVYAYPNTFIETTKSRDIFGIMTSPILIQAIIVVTTYFLVSNILSLYSIAVNAIFLCYISDLPEEVSRKRKYSSSNEISKDMNPDKFDVLRKLNDLE